MRRLFPVEAWLALSVFAYHCIFIGIIQDFGWDDGAITLAFSRTLSETGKVALTPYSEVVEGYSSTLWMAAMAILHWLFRPDFSWFIRTTQLSAALLCSLSAILFFRIFRQVVGGRSSTVFVISFLLFIQKPFLNEAVNGMEMLAAGTLALLLMFFAAQADARPSDARDGSYLISLVTVSAISSLIRFEFILYLLGASYVLWRKHRNLSLGIGIGGLVGFTANAIHRGLYFKDILPNTIYAKRWPPYKDFQLDSIQAMLARLDDATSGGVEVFKANSALFFLLFGLLLFLLILARPSRGLTVVASQTLDNSATCYAIGFSILVITFSMITGRNAGHESRMQLMAVPLMILLVSFWIKQLSLELGPIFKTAIPSYICLAIICASMINLPVATAIRAGISYNILDKDPLASDQPEKGYGVSPAGYQYTGQSVDRIRELLHMKVITFLVPDVGGLGLGSPKINVLDSALLTNRKLAHSGYNGFAEYFYSAMPDVIETHGIWSEASGIYKLKSFRESYTPIAVDANWLYVRNDHYKELLRGGFLVNAPRGSNGRHYRYRGYDVDEEFISSMAFDSSAMELTPPKKSNSKS